MSLSNKEIVDILSATGVGPDYRTPDAKFGSYPKAEEIRDAIKDKSLDAKTGILFVSPDFRFVETVHMIARFMAYPCRRSAYLGASMAFYDLLRGLDNPRLLSPADEEGFNFAKHVFLTDFCLSDRSTFPHGDDLREFVESFIIEARYRYHRVFHLHSYVHPSKMKMFSPRFMDFLQKHYRVFEHTPSVDLKV